MACTMAMREFVLLLSLTATVAQVVDQAHLTGQKREAFMQAQLVAVAASEQVNLKLGNFSDYIEGLNATLSNSTIKERLVRGFRKVALQRMAVKKADLEVSLSENKANLTELAKQKTNASNKTEMKLYEKEWAKFAKGALHDSHKLKELTEEKELDHVIEDAEHSEKHRSKKYEHDIKHAIKTAKHAAKKVEHAKKKAHLGEQAAEREYEKKERDLEMLEQEAEEKAEVAEDIIESSYKSMKHIAKATTKKATPSPEPSTEKSPSGAASTLLQVSFTHVLGKNGLCLAIFATAAFMIAFARPIAKATQQQQEPLLSDMLL